MKQIFLAIFVLASYHSFSQEKDTIRFMPTKNPYLNNETITVLPEDTTYFRIVLIGKTWHLKLKQKWQVLERISQLDKTIQNNKSSIDANKILLIISPEAEFGVYMKATTILKKQGYSHFHLIPKDYSQ